MLVKYLQFIKEEKFFLNWFLIMAIFIAVHVKLYAYVKQQQGALSLLKIQSDLVGQIGKMEVALKHLRDGTTSFEPIISSSDDSPIVYEGTAVLDGVYHAVIDEEVYALNAKVGPYILKEISMEYILLYDPLTAQTRMIHIKNESTKVK